jgi:YHS domain-containing protein
LIFDAASQPGLDVHALAGAISLLERPGRQEKQMPRKSMLLTSVLAALGLVYLAGCDSGSRPEPESRASGVRPAKPTVATAPPAPAEHAHHAGAHGGNVVEIGRDNYHAEAVFEAGGTVRLYLLGADESRVLEVESQTLTAYAKPEGSTEAVAVTLDPDPQSGDTTGKTSRFSGKLPATLAGKALEATVPSIRIAGERFRFSFSSAGAAHDESLPPKVSGAEENDLYLKPGGLYTADDIRANGGKTASEKFRGEKASHNVKSQPGDPICPVTLTKANPKFTWIIGGKAYQFCCPPCVDEFVTLAKEHPEQVKAPEEYRKH